ncbi:MAG: lipopolysaccharide biosynthesis protein, partial [Calditrichaeota bacterium]
TKVGIVYNTAARLAGTFGQFFSAIILARLLAPQDFGLVATAMMVIGFATKFGEFGFHMGLIQRKEEIREEHINTLFLMDFSFKITLWAIIYFLTPHIANYFHNPLLADVLPVIALYMIFECFSTTPLTVLKRRMDFKSTSIIGTIERFVTLISSIIFALLGFKFWSLIYSKLIGISTSAILATARTRWIPKPKFNRQACSELFRFGVMISLRNLFRYGSDKIDYFFISKYLGSQQLGFYEKAFELMRLPQRRITRSVNKVVFSAFSRIQDQPERIRQAFKKLILAISLVSYPLLAGMAFVAPLFIPIVLGAKWQSTVIPLQIMCVAGILRSMDPFLNSLLTTTGYVKSTVTRRALELALLASTTFYGVKYGIIGVSIAIVVSAIIVMLIMLSIITRVSQVTWWDYFGAQVPAFVTSAGMLGSMYLNTLWLRHFIAPNGAAMLLAQVAIGAVTYLSLHLIFRFPAVMALWAELASDTKGALGKLARKKRKTKSKKEATPLATVDAAQK